MKKSSTNLLLVLRGCSRKKGAQGPWYLVSRADWMLGTARALVSLSHYSDEV